MRRESRSAIPERLKVAARDDNSDDEWDPYEAVGASDEEDSAAEDSDADGGAKRGRVTAHYIVQRKGRRGVEGGGKRVDKSKKGFEKRPVCGARALAARDLPAKCA